MTEKQPERGIFPDENTTRVLHEANKILIARTLVKFVPSLNGFRSNVSGHIKHQYSKEMAEKSETVSIHTKLLKTNQNYSDCDCYFLTNHVIVKLYINFIRYPLDSFSELKTQRVKWWQF